MTAPPNKKNRKPFAVVTRGSVSVKIYGPKRGPWTIIWRGLDGSRQRVMRSDLAKAKSLAEEKATAIANGETSMASLTQEDRASYLRAREIIAPSGKSLELVAAEWMHMSSMLESKGGSPTEAARFWISHHAGIKEISTTDAFEMFMKEYELKLERKEPGASERYIGDLRSRLGMFKDYFDCPLGAIAGTQIQNFLDSKNGAWATRTRTNFIRMLRTFFAWAKRRDFLSKEHDELRKVDRLEEHRREPAIYTPRQMRELLTHSTTDSALTVFLAVCGFAGLRSAEFLRLDWSEVHLERQPGYIEVPGSKSKTRTSRIVPIADNLRIWLAPEAKRAGRMWPYRASRLYDLTERLCKKSGIEWKANALRHSFISYRIADIKNLAQVALEAGNSPRIIQTNYNRPIPEDQAKEWFGLHPLHQEENLLPFTGHDFRPPKAETA